MRKRKFLPKLAWNGVVKNGTVYFPYLGAGVFSVFTYFVFSSILHNDIIGILPHSMYVWTLLQVGRVLLGFIMLGFLFYTNSFLIKYRKKEIGLYHILGLEKRHVTMMLALETVLIFAVSFLAGIVTGGVFAKLIFLILLNMSGMGVQGITFHFTAAAVWQTFAFFAFIYVLNFINNIRQLWKNKPIELLGAGKAGEKEPKRWILVVLTLAGTAVLFWGYRIAWTAQVDTWIFTNFFLAVLLVILGTYFLFTSGSIAILKFFRRQKGFYYRSANFITVSGMLYRMKKNAAGLVNICIFSTMVLITLTCTVSLYLGQEDILKFDYPYDVEIECNTEYITAPVAEEKISELAAEKKVSLVDEVCMRRALFYGVRVDGGMCFSYEEKEDEWLDRFYLISLSDYHAMTGQNAVLGDGECYVFSTGPDYGQGQIDLPMGTYRVKEELSELPGEPKADANRFSACLYVIVPDEKEIQDCLALARGSIGYITPRIQEKLMFHIQGDETQKQEFLLSLKQWTEGKEGIDRFDNSEEGRGMIRAMCGGLLFLGVFFSLIFGMCLCLIMYYKQISEGNEDKGSFSIMQKVGMSDPEIRGTIRRQILLVFFVPLFAAALHTFVGARMVVTLFATIRLFNNALIYKSAGAVIVLFAVLYGGIYRITAKTYYRLVRSE